MQNPLESVAVVRQHHPGITLDTPFEVIREYRREAMKELVGDVHQALQLSIVLAGGAEVNFNGHSLSCGPGEMWWTGRWEPHAWRLTGRRNYLLTINITPDALGECAPFAEADFRMLFDRPPRERFTAWTAAGRERLKRQAKELLRSCLGRELNPKTRTWLVIHQILLDRLAVPAGSGNARRPEFERVKEAVALLNRTPPPTLAEAAQACRLSVSRFSQLFRRAMQVSFGRYALHFRLEAAARDVASGRYTLEDIARRHGFCDAAGFCNAFKRVYRCRPSQFRRR